MGFYPGISGLKYHDLGVWSLQEALESQAFPFQNYMGHCKIKLTQTEHHHRFQQLVIKLHKPRGIAVLTLTTDVEFGPLIFLDVVGNVCCGEEEQYGFHCLYRSKHLPISPQPLPCSAPNVSHLLNFNHLQLAGLFGARYRLQADSFLTV